MIASSNISYLGLTDFRNQFVPFGIRQTDRTSHLYCLGKTGAGKTTLLETLLTQDIAAGRGCALIDPHGDLVSRLAANIPVHRQKDLIYLNAPDPLQPFGYNPLKHVPERYQPLAAAGLLEVFKKLWTGTSWGVRMEHILRNTLLALLSQPDATLDDITRMLTDKKYRMRAVRNITNEPVREFWTKEFPQYSYRLRADAIAPIQNKVGAFLANPIARKILTRPEKPLSLRRCMDDEKILLVNLAKGQLGEDPAHLLGALLVTTIGLAAFSRTDQPETERKPFFLTVDECQNFTTLAFASMSSELRKFNVGLVVANQYRSQQQADIQEALMGNMGTLISFRVGAKDAAHLSREFAHRVSPEELVMLPNYTVIVKLLKDGAPLPAFRAKTLQPHEVFELDQRRCPIHGTLDCSYKCTPLELRKLQSRASSPRTTYTGEVEDSKEQHEPRQRPAAT